ncbi:uncharacterized protein MYCGRDRAFT_97584 [Zymoseptoria tritici IPO323]|uniref:F-box domain-containing protein n=1 Tax=Zymoseptoria tritici (strain CBS 115943 / IPO323) TaxID=336722 RepID=F9XQQ0_ZYMTI|nr:uncharacterized protein MYCGRDRAFT_97584 [Zymoseptoria tritici IPO323]EGP82446.1 hypothetical protein MYCGRDRAFT_97584 [Zymoseptoria tritici IPO323]
MFRTNILSIIPKELLHHVFASLASCASDIGACRLTCHEFHELSSEYFISRAVLAPNLEDLQVLSQNLLRPQFFRHATQLILVEAYNSWEDEDKYDQAFEEEAWTEIPDKDRKLWQDLSRFTDFPNEGPESQECIDISKVQSSAYIPTFYEYTSAIRYNILAELLKILPKLYDVALLDYPSACVEGLVSNMFADENYESRPMWPWRSYDSGRDFCNLFSLLGSTTNMNIRSVTVGPYFFERGRAYWDKHRDENIVVDRRELSHHLLLDAVDAVWAHRSQEETRIIGGLRRLSLPFVLDEYSIVESRRMTSLPTLVKLAAPNLTHLMLDAEWLTHEQPLNAEDAEDDLGLLGFRAFIAQIRFPNIADFSLSGWAYHQTDMEQFLVRHGSTLQSEIRELEEK